MLGHLAPIYCLSYDRTGSCVITGSDDSLLKIWKSETLELLATLRGHASEITDLCVSQDNSMVATGSLDKIVRVWSLRNSDPISVLAAHTGIQARKIFLLYLRNSLNSSSIL